VPDQKASAKIRKADFDAWASAHKGKWGQLTPLGKMDEKIKSENMQKEQFSEWGWENGAMLTTYLFRYTSECTIS